MSLSLYGLFYRAYPDATNGWLPHVHFATAATGVLTMAPALALLLLGAHAAEPAVAIGALLSIVGMLSFAMVVLRTTLNARGRLAPGPV